MPHGAKLRNKWKVKVLNWAEALTNVHSKPVAKLIAEVISGILSSGSLQLTEISRALKEPKRLHHTVKRLSRMLGKHALWPELEGQILSRLAPSVGEEMILAIDPGDLNRDGAPKSEHRGRVRDGSKGEIVGGYPLLNVVARDPKKGTTLPLFCRLYSYQEKEFVSENNEILTAMRRVQSAIGSKRLWVIDRGGDRSALWDIWLEEGFDVLVRVTKQRHWLRGNFKGNVQDLAKQLPTKHRGKLRSGSDKDIRFGLTRVRLPEHPDRPLSLIVVRHGKREPMILVSTRLVRGKRQGERLIHSYLDRWVCEEGYRFSKQGFGLERVQARSYKVLRNLVALAMASWALLAEEQHQAEELIQRGKRQKDKQRHRPKFTFYSILKGWQQLFAEAATLLHDRLRRGKPPGPLMQLALPGLGPRL
jgi:hypothetical protein